MAWRIAKSLDVLRNEVNALWPNRSKASDGVIGDTAHASGPSDHNPNPQGDVCAFDITHDPANGCDIAALYAYLRAHPHPNQKYIIANGRIASRKYGWEDRAYTKDPHTSHIHVSVGVGLDGQSAPGTYDDTSPWLTGFGAPSQGEDDMTDEEHVQLWNTRADLQSLHVKVDQLTAIVDKFVKSGGGAGAATSLPVKGGTVTIEY